MTFQNLCKPRLWPISIGVDAIVLDPIVVRGPVACRCSDAHHRVHGRLNSRWPWLCECLPLSTNQCGCARALTSTRVRASVNAHSRAHTQNPNEFEVRFTPDATYTGYKLRMQDNSYFDLNALKFGRQLTLTTSAYPESHTQTYFAMQHLSHKPFTQFVNCPCRNTWLECDVRSCARDALVDDFERKNGIYSG